jgi:hypothetical protein
MESCPEVDAVQAEYLRLAEALWAVVTATISPLSSRSRNPLPPRMSSRPR